MANKKSEGKQRLKTVQDRFADWRKNHKGRDRIPEPLWDATASAVRYISRRIENDKEKKILETQLRQSQKMESMANWQVGLPMNSTMP